MTAGTSAIAAMVSAERSLGWLVANRMRVDAGVGDRAQHLGEALLSVEVATVAVHVLAEQRDLDVRRRPRGCRTSAYDLLDGSRPLPAAHVRNDAVRAEVVAADGDGNPGVPRVLALAWAGRWRNRCASARTST